MTRKAKSSVQWKLHIRFRALLHMAVANLRFKAFRSAITIIGIAIGTGSIFILMSFGLGLQDLVAKQISQGQSINTIDVGTSGSQVLKINSAAVKNIAAIQHVQSVSGFYAKASKLTVGGATADVVAYGVDPLYLRTSNLSMSAGTNIDPNKTNQVAISASILEAIGITDAKRALGTTTDITIKLPDDSSLRKTLTIVGVIASGNGSEAFLSHKLFEGEHTTDYAGAKALVDTRAHVTDTRRAIEGLGFVTTSPVDTLNQVDQFFRVLRIILVGFGAVGMTIAILGMINTLTVSLLERTREVALMLALGARPQDMRLLFTLEAVTLSIVGGIIGIISAMILGAGVDIVLNTAARSRGAVERFTVFASPFWLIILALAAMALVGFLVAYAPARRASRINSIDALRRE